MGTDTKVNKAISNSCYAYRRLIQSFGSPTTSDFATQNIPSPTGKSQRKKSSPPLVFLPSLSLSLITSLQHCTSCWVLDAGVGGELQARRWAGGVAGGPRDREGSTDFRREARASAAAMGAIMIHAGPTSSHHLPWPQRAAGLAGRARQRRRHGHQLQRRLPSLKRLCCGAFPTLPGNEVEVGYAVPLRPLSP